MMIVYALGFLLVLLGLRLIVLGLRRRSAPEIALGVALACLRPGAMVLDHGLREPASGLIAFGLLGVTIGTAAVGCFAQLTFRRRQPLAQVWTALLIALLAYGHLVALPMLETTRTPSLFYLAIRLLVMAWAATEALLHRATYARRAAIGLADPIIANRFLLFAGWIGMMAFNSVLLMVVVALDRRGGVIAWQPVVFALARGVAVLDLILMSLIFFAPRRYTAWIERRHERRLEHGEVMP